MVERMLNCFAQALKIGSYCGWVFAPDGSGVAFARCFSHSSFYPLAPNIPSSLKSVARCSFFKRRFKFRVVSIFLSVIKISRLTQGEII